jgi:hypothetical protein
MYGLTSDVRELAGLGVSTQDFTDPEIIEEQETAKDIIDLKTGRTWSSDDDTFQLIQRIENLLAASLIIAHGGSAAKEESESFWTRAMELLEIVISSSAAGETSDIDVLFASSNYLSYPLGLDNDTNTVPHRSTRIRTFY